MFFPWGNWGENTIIWTVEDYTMPEVYRVYRVYLTSRSNYAQCQFSPPIIFEGITHFSLFGENTNIVTCY
jgi:hypothetical protein